MKNPLIIGNWKLNGNKFMVKDMLTKLCKNLSGIYNCDIGIAPPLVYLNLAKQCLINNNQINLVAQNVDIHISGNYTGETSANMLKDIGVKYAIIGHSERRIFHKESNEYIAEKFAVLKNVGIIPILCIGENKIENQTKQTESVCAYQLNVIIDNLGIKSFYKVVIAYEPIWAIGTGECANLEYIQNIHKFIRNHIAHYDKDIAQQLMIQYGGSVTALNANKLLMQTDIDGILIGKASLQNDSFEAIIKSIEKDLKQ